MCKDKECQIFSLQYLKSIGIIIKLLESKISLRIVGRLLVGQVGCHNYLFFNILVHPPLNINICSAIRFSTLSGKNSSECQDKIGKNYENILQSVDES